MAKQLIVLIALAMGGWMILDSLSTGLSAVIYALDQPANVLFFVVSLVPAALATGIAYLLYRYATNIEAPTQDIGDSILFGGAKLLGIYFLVQALSRTIVGLTTALSEIPGEYWLSFLLAATHLVFA